MNSVNPRLLSKIKGQAYNLKYAPQGPRPKGIKMSDENTAGSTEAPAEEAKKEEAAE